MRKNVGWFAIFIIQNYNTEMNLQRPCGEYSASGKFCNRRVVVNLLGANK